MTTTTKENRVNLNPSVTFTVDFTADGTRTLTTYKDVPKVEFHLMELQLHDIRGETLRWTTTALLGAPPDDSFVNSPSTGNFSVSYVADGGAKWTDAASQDGIPQVAADLIVGKIKAALSPLAAYAVP